MLKPAECSRATSSLQHRRCQKREAVAAEERRVNIGSSGCKQRLQQRLQQRALEQILTRQQQIKAVYFGAEQISWRWPHNNAAAIHGNKRVSQQEKVKHQRKWSFFIVIWPTTTMQSARVFVGGSKNS